MEKIEPGKFVELTYDLFAVNPDGTETQVHHTDDNESETLVFGVTPGVIQPLEKALEGLTVGDTFDVVAKAAEAFGAERDPEQIVTLPRDVFMVDGKFDEDVVKVGAPLPMMTADGMRITGMVIEVTPDDVKMDFNHPLTGRDIRFKGKVKTVRDATPEDLQPASGCGCNGGGCGGCDTDSNCDCGSQGGCCGCN